MDITVQQAIDTSRILEKQLSNQLTANNVSYSQIEESLNKICAACSGALYYDFESATAHHAENRLWDSHQKVNTYYRSALEKLKNSEEPTVVARRKLEGSYLRFIKTAQKFYRGYIRELAAVHGNVPELERAAKKVGGESQTRNDRRRTQAQRQHLLLSLHTTLIHLGDLSRYRESELTAKERNWGPAVGFYDLATSVLPSSGISYNQLAVIALADGNLFRATYQLYRAMSTEDPHPQAEANLRRAFYKISSAWKSNELAGSPAMTAGASLPRGLVAFYLRLLSTYYHGKAFPEREELESEVISQLETDLKKRPSESAPTKLVIINIAAGYAAQERLLKLEGSEDAMQSYLFLLRLNIRTFMALLKVLQSELDGCELHAISHDALSTNVTLTMQRTLPVLRLYGSWLFKNINVLANDIDTNFAPLQVDFWTCFARVISSINAKFPPQYLPQPLDYMLEEDEDTIGFKALQCEENSHIWYEGEAIKQKWHELASGQKKPSAEKLSRLRDLLAAGVALAVDQRTPIELEADSATFIYKRNSLDEELPAVVVDETSVQQLQPSLVVPPSANGQPIHTVSSHEESHTLENDVEANAMVDSLVGLDADLDLSVVPPKSPMTPPSHNSTSPFHVGTHNAQDLLEVVRSYSQSGHNGSSMPASTLLPGLGQSPFTEPCSPIGVQPPLRSPALGTSAFIGWGTPQQQPHASGSRPGTALQPPLVPPGLGRHSRMNSTESITSPWLPDNTWSTYAPTDAQNSLRPNRRSLLDRSLGNGTFGDIFTRRESQQGRSESFRGSPLFGAFDGWGTPERSTFGQLASPATEHSRQLPYEPVSGNPVASIGTGRPRPIK